MTFPPRPFPRLSPPKHESVGQTGLAPFYVTDEVILLEDHMDFESRNTEYGV